MWKKLVISIGMIVLLSGCGKEEQFTIEITDGSEASEIEEVVNEATTVDETTGEADDEGEVAVVSEVMASGRQIVETYYMYYNNKAVDDIYSLLDESLIEMAGGQEKAFMYTSLRLYAIGNLTDYEVIESMEDDAGKSHFTVTATYETGQVAEEKFVIKDQKIQELHLDDEANTKRLIENYFTSIGTFDELKTTLLPMVLEQYETDSFIQKNQLLKSLAGDYEDYEVLEGGYLLKDIPEMNLLCLYQAPSLLAHFSNMDVYGEIQISFSDGHVGINYTDLYPQPLVAYYLSYLGAIKSGNVDAVMTMFSDHFYTMIDGDRDTWRETISYLVNDMAEMTQYKLENWNYEEKTMADGSVAKLMALSAYVYYGDVPYHEVLVINYDEATPMIQEYQIIKVE